MLLASSLLVFVAAACGGGGAATPVPGQATQPVGAATPAPGQPTPAGPTQAPPPPVGGAVATVVITGGPDAGTYTGAGDPACSFGFLGTGFWGVVYGNEAATAGQLGGVTMTLGQGSSGSIDSVNVSVTIGPMLGGTLYTITNVTDTTGATTAQVTDNGATAVIHASGPTLDGSATVDVTVNCPSVTRV